MNKYSHVTSKNAYKAINLIKNREICTTKFITEKPMQHEHLYIRGVVVLCYKIMHLQNTN